MPIPAVVAELVERFERNYASYVAPTYNEEQLRIEFANPFFEALGWDVSNVAGSPEQYKDVIHEDALKIGGTTKAPDYAFRIGGQRKFFLETKRPGVNIALDPAPALQLRRYAYTASLPLSILTNFRDLAIYDGRIQPDKKDAPSKARLKIIPFREYARRWDEIAGLFSLDSIRRGAFDAYAAQTTRRGTATFDVAFLREIEGWRATLATHIATRNAISPEDLNLAVGRIIDRIIFLRICEENGIEPRFPLMALRGGANTYQRLVEQFHRADARYNSGLFHFRAEPNRHEEPDELTTALKLDNKPIKDILTRLYFPAPYAFNVMPLEILGQIYEQFLGKVIRLEGKSAVVEEKPEVKKAGGVYYTPAYIVNAIVAQTIGALCRDKTPAQVAKLKVLDPACGSGSFLLGAYEYLLGWHLDWYLANEPEKHARGKNPPLYRAGGDEANVVWRLTPRERKRIVRDNIFGVDIDRQAVEVTKLSLLLKVLEGESDESISNQLRLLHERALPDLGDNIKCGNSLIEPDFEFDDGGNPKKLSDEERKRVNPFRWAHEYSSITKAGGFDAIIGNPPYVRIQALKEWAPLQVEHFKNAYQSAAQGNYDLYVIFVERALQLLNKDGRMGYILPHKFFNAQYGEKLRELLSKGAHVSEIVNFGDKQIFSTATTYTCLLFASRAANENVRVSRVDDLLAWQTSGQATIGEVPSSTLSKSEWNFAIGNNAALFEKLGQMPVKLGDVAARIFQGIKTSADKIYIVEELEREENRVKIYSRQTEGEYWVEPDLLHPLIKGGDSKRYALSRTKRLIIFPYAREGEANSKLIQEAVFKEQFPLTWGYLEANKTDLENREDGKMRGSNWYGYGRIQALDVMPLPKIFTPDLASRASYSLDAEGDAFFTGGASGGYGILIAPQFSREYILALLNSQLLEWFNIQIAARFRGGYYSWEARFIRQLPIRAIDFSNKADKARHDTMVKLVERMLELQKQKAQAKTVAIKSGLESQIAATDAQIDKLVYALYDLSEDEIAIVERRNADGGT